MMKWNILRNKFVNTSASFREGVVYSRVHKSHKYRKFHEVYFNIWQ